MKLALLARKLFILLAGVSMLLALPAQAALVCPTSTPGSGSITGAVNDYWIGSGSPSAGATSISLGTRRSGGAGSDIVAGDLVLIIQMQDADINSGNSNVYGSGGTSGSGSTALNSTGLYEYVVATGSVTGAGGTLSFSSALTNSYRTRAYVAGSNGKSTWQAIRIPRYSSATATNVNTPLWNGETGGVVALDVIGALTLSGTTAINVAGRGFRGGAGREHDGATTGADTDWRTTSGTGTGTGTNNANASKAEGIAGTPRYVNAPGSYNGTPVQTDTGVEGYPNGSYARGAPGNAGGGGTDGETATNQMNTGGGGGGNYGAGGLGGNAWNSNEAIGGLGGAGYSGTLDFNRVFLGGGGGAGTTNNATDDAATYSNPPGLSCSSGALCSSGAAGGGMVIIRAGSVTGTGLIDARGADAYNVDNDSSGGGGAGGTIVLQTYSGGSATVNASGGNGGNAWRSTTAMADRHGPGGGGGGGFIAYSPSTGLTLSATYAGGLSGRTSNGDSYGTTSSAGGLSAFDTPNVPGAQAGAFCPPAIKAVRLYTDGGTSGQVDPGDTLEYTVIYRNGSSTSVTGFNITDTLSASLTYVSSSLAITASGGASGSANASYNGTSTTSLLSSTTTLPSGGIIQATFRATVSAGATCGSNIFNQADSVQSGGEDIDLTDNADNSQNSNGLPTATYISQTSYGTSGATDQTGVTIFCAAISGRVYEDPNYGGGSGRSYAAASGVAVPNVRVELYNSGNTFVSATTTDASGNYSFSGISNGNYTVRVVNSSIASTRAGACAAGTCLPVQTWRADASSGTAAPVTDRVGGENPVVADAANVTVVGTALPANAQSITSVAYSGTLVSGVDFGYNFDTIVNVNNTGQGSLRQFITNANALGGDGSLAQAGNRIDLVTGSSIALASGEESSIFMITDGNAHAGLRAGLTSQLTAGRALVGITTLLPALSTTMSIEGGTQTYNIGNTNNVTLGAGGTVGTAATSLPQINGPEVELRDGPLGNTGLALGFDVADTAAASNVIIRGMAIGGFGGTSDSNTNANILFRNAAANGRVEGNVIGTTALAFSSPGYATPAGDNIRVDGAETGIILNNLIGFSDGNGIGTDASSSSGWLIQGNEVRGNSAAGVGNAGIELADFRTGTVQYNLITANLGGGLVIEDETGDSNTITGNTITNNGTGATTRPGILIQDADNATISYNIVFGSGDAGIVMEQGATGNRITQNSTYSNGGLGIDLSNTNGATQGDGVTINDSVDGDTGGNDRLNLPVIETATCAFAGAMTVTGWARPGSIIEFFVRDNDATSFGEGMTYLTTATEGSGADTNATISSTYGPGNVNGLAQGTDTTNKFTFSFTGLSGFGSSPQITATATDASNNTSEFSGRYALSCTGPSLVFLKTLSTYSDPLNGTSSPYNIPGAYVDYTLRVTNTGSGTVDNNSIAIVDPIPANTELFTGDSSGSGAPFVFTNSGSGLACGFTALGNFSDCVDFSTNGTTWNVLTPNGSFDPAVTHIRFKPTGTMNGSGAYFDLQFRVRIK